MKKTKIDIRISELALEEINNFLSRYKNENHSTLIQKSMRRFIRLYQSDIIDSRMNGIEKGNEKIHSKVNSKTLEDFNHVCKNAGYTSFSQAIRAAVRYYMSVEPYIPLKALNLNNNDIKQRPVIIIEGE